MLAEGIQLLCAKVPSDCTIDIVTWWAQRHERNKEMPSQLVKVEKYHVVTFFIETNGK